MIKLSFDLVTKSVVLLGRYNNMLWCSNIMCFMRITARDTVTNCKLSINVKRYEY